MRQTDLARKRVAVLVGSSLTWREEVMRGISGFSTGLKSPWHVYTAPEGSEDSLFFSERYRWDGLIVRPASARMMQRVEGLGKSMKVPVVAIGSTTLGGAKIARVRVDDEALMRAALEHLKGRGIERVAYCSPFSSRGAEARGAACIRVALEMGLKMTAFYLSARAKSWVERQRVIGRWLRSLQKPVGVVTWNPDVACQVVEACHEVGVRIPDEVAVLSADDDRAKCELTSPTISAVPIPAIAIGHAAASMLASMMGGKVAGGTVLVQPTGLVLGRESTAVAMNGARDVEQSVAWIRGHVGASSMRVESVARAVGVSRRSLERLFRERLGRSPGEEILRQRLEVARRLLLETELKIQAVGQRGGVWDLIAVLPGLWAGSR